MRLIKFIILVGCFAVSFMNYGQSKSYFVKISGDTIQCKITRISESYLFYSIESVRSRIEIDGVKFHTGVSRSESMDDSQITIPEESVSEVDKLFNYTNAEDFINPQRFRLALNLAGGYRIAQAGDLPRSYVNKLRKGIQYSAKAQYFGRKDVGFGVEFHQFFNNVEDRLPTIGDVVDDITISYLGLSTIQRRLESDAGNRSFVEFGLGIVFFENMGELNSQAVNIEGTTFGLNLAYGYDVVISKNLMAGFEIGILLARLNSVKVNGQTVTAQNPEDGESLTRINFGMGLRFSK